MCDYRIVVWFDLSQKTARLVKENLTTSLAETTFCYANMLSSCTLLGFASFWFWAGHILPAELL